MMSHRSRELKQSIYDLDACFAMVQEFQSAIADPAPKHPTPLDAKRVSMRIAWMRDEITELETAEAMVQQVDALCDLIYFALGTFVEMGVPPGPAFTQVHEANMRKVDSTEGARFSPEGRLQKPRGWTGPEAKIEEYLSALQKD